jgi:hypothetical protein
MVILPVDASVGALCLVVPCSEFKHLHRISDLQKNQAFIDDKTRGKSRKSSFTDTIADTDSLIGQAGTRRAELVERRALSPRPRHPVIPATLSAAQKRLLPQLKLGVSGAQKGL